MLTGLALLLSGMADTAPQPAALEVAPEAPPVILMPPPIPPSLPFFNLPPPPTQLPQAIRDLAEAAFREGDRDAANSILKTARRSNPQAIAQIEALEAEFAARRAEQAAREARERAEKLAAASLLDNWKGEVELGGSRSTGNVDSVAIYGAVRFEREGLKWRHLINGRVDFQRSNGITTADRLKFGWEPNKKVNEALFIYGLGQYERDRFLGFDSRYTLSSGVGLMIISTPRTKLSIQGGPAVRYTDYVDKGAQVAGAGRASVSFRWKVSPTLEISQDAAVYLEGNSENALSTTTLESRLLGGLKMRLSYDVQYETDGIAGGEPLDTTSRATLVYSF
jgi:putative salt-induced outer membrane protein